MKQPAQAEVLNDINGDVTNLYRVLQHHLEEFVRQFKWSLVSREMYRWLQITPEETLTDIQRGALLLSAKSWHSAAKWKVARSVPPPPHRRALNLLRMEEDLSAAHLRAGARLH